jgi:hypothetical protein
MGRLEEGGGDIAREVSLLPHTVGVGAVEGGVMSLFGTSVTVDLAGVGEEWCCGA